MEAENLALALSTPRAVCTDEGANEHSSPEAVDGFNLESNVVNQVGDGNERTPEVISRQNSGHSKISSGNLPDFEHCSMEVELMRAQERIVLLQLDLANAEKKLADSEKKHLEEVSVLQCELKSSASIVEDKVNSLESEWPHLVEEHNALKGENSNLLTQLETAKLVHKELQGQVDGLKETVHMFEKKMSDVDKQAKETKKNLLAEVEACQIELSTKAEAFESLSNVHSELQRELQEVKSKSADSALIVEEQIRTLEGMLKSAQDGLKAKEAVASCLQAEVVNLKSKLSEIIIDSEERLKLLEGEHQEQLKFVEERCELLQKSIPELEERNSQLKNTLGAARSDGEVAKGKLVELELQLERLLHAKSKSEEGVIELQSQIKSLEEMLNKQVDNFKMAVENADAASEQVVQLQILLKTTEEMLRASKEAADSLQEQVTVLTSKEMRSGEHLKVVEKGSQKIQLQLQSKLETLEATNSQLEEKIAQLHDSLSVAILDGDSARKKVSELQVELTSLHYIQGELEEKVRFFEEKCSQHEDTADIMRMRVLELEGLIIECRKEADGLNGKVVTLDAALMDSQKLVADLQMQLTVAKDNHLQLEDTSAACIAKLENNVTEYHGKIEELKKILAEKHTENILVTDKLTELKLSMAAVESDLKGASQREMLLNGEKTFVEEKLVKLEVLTAKLEEEKNDLTINLQEHKSLAEKSKIGLHEASVLEKKLRDEMSSLQASMSAMRGLLTQAEEEKQATVNQLDSARMSFADLNDQLVEERQQLQQQIATIMQETGVLREKFACAQEKLLVALEAAELSAKQVQQGILKESNLSAQVEMLNLELKKALDACGHTEILQQEKANLAQEVVSAQEMLQAALEAAELSARQLQAASLKELELNAEIGDLKVQLGKAMDDCAQVERLEQTLESSITREEHQTQMDQLLAASRLAESKLAVVEEQLLKSKLEIKEVQKNVSEQETYVEELDVKTVKSLEVFDQQLSDSTRSREIDLDVPSPGKIRNRKKKGVGWETDAAGLTPKIVVHKKKQSSARILSHYVAHLLIAVVSLTIGFWLASGVHA